MSKKRRRKPPPAPASQHHPHPHLGALADAAAHAVLKATAQPTGVADPRRLGGTIAGPGGSRDRSTVVLDMTDCVLLQSMDVAAVDAIRNGVHGGKAVFMTLAGRVNNTRDQVQVGFMFGPDGAAALITELLSLADRFGAEMLRDLTTRFAELARGDHVDLAFLRAAIDNAIEGGPPPPTEGTP